MQPVYPQICKALFRSLSRTLLLCLAVAVVFCNGCSTARPGERGGTFELRGGAIPKPAEVGAGQLILVVGEGGGRNRARLYALEGAADSWRVHRGPLPAMVGRNGFAAPGEKVEGDGRSPAGLFPLEFVFGYDPGVKSRMPYRQATGDDLWVDDVSSPQYNTWVRRGETAAKSFEEMRLPDIRYRHGVVIGYNRNPIIKGKGSAIFMHAWLEDGKPTAGCVSLDENELVGIIEWLDPAEHPMILMGNESDLPAIAAGIGRKAP